MDLTSGKKLLTLADLDAMVREGILAADDRVELLEGEVVKMAPIGPPHAARVSLLQNRLAGLLGDRAQVRPQCPAFLDDHSVPVPDLAVVTSRADYYAKAHPAPGDILCLIEVADTSVTFDQRRKAPLYAAKGIREMWIFNLPKDLLEVYRAPGPTGYSSIVLVRRGDWLSFEALPDLRLEAAILLPEPVG
jgi:Uma2 family endonuclease